MVVAQIFLSLNQGSCSVVASYKTHHAICILRLQVNTAHHINPDQALLRSALRKLSELAGWNWHPWVIRQRVNLE